MNEHQRPTLESPNHHKWRRSGNVSIRFGSPLGCYVAKPNKWRNQWHLFRSLEPEFPLGVYRTVEDAEAAAKEIEAKRLMWSTDQQSEGGSNEH